MNNKKTGFTLAEVLITLAIIGVVAALTIPTLITNYEKKETVTRLQKATAVITQAFRMAQANHGDTGSWDYSDGTGEGTVKFLQEYIIPNLNISKVCDPNNNNEACFSKYVYKLDGVTPQNTINNTWATFVLNDGTSIAAKNSLTKEDGITTVQQLSFRIDINGIKKPNRSGRDIYCFDIRPYSINSSYPQYTELRPCMGGVEDRNKLLKSNGDCASDKTSHGLGCARLIMLDDWKISDDYPW